MTVPITVPEILRAAAETYEQRNTLYGDNYKMFGMTMATLFPSGLRIINADDWNRLGIIVQCVSKISRYCHNINIGHVDSAHDLIVYAAMLEELTRKEG